MLDWIQRLFGSGDVRPVSAALQIEAGDLTERITQAVSAIDRVHRDGRLPPLPVREATLRGLHGFFAPGDAGQPRIIVINSATWHAELTVVHEIGHFLDFAGLDAAGQYASATSPMLGDWRAAVKKSAAVQELGRLLRPDVVTVSVKTSGETVVEYPVDKTYAAYLVEAEELWARCYAQFVAVESGDPEMLAQLEHRRRRPVTGIDYPVHWSDADFEPIAQEMKVVFRQKRWMQ